MNANGKRWKHSDKTGWSLIEGEPIKNPTIYAALKKKLGREPTHRELTSDVRRILEEGTREQAERGKLKHQRKR